MPRFADWFCLRPFTRFIAPLLLAVSAAPPAQAGNGPHNWLVVYDPNDPDAPAIVRHYQQARGIPDRNLVPYAFPDLGFDIRFQLNGTQGWDFLQFLRAEITDRGLDGQIHGILLTGQVPNSYRTASPNSVASLTTALSMAPGMTSLAEWEARTDDTNAAYRGPDSSNVSDGPTRPTTEIRSDLEFEGERYWLSTHLGYTGLHGLRRDEVIDLIDRSVAADGTAPEGTVYWPLNINVRSRIREGQALPVLPEWERIGIQSHIFGQSFGGGGFTLPENKTGAPGSFPINERAVRGAIVGSTFFDVEGAGSLFLPGSLAEHITSFGGVMGNGLNFGQTVATEWLRFGASGTSGTVTEPNAIAEKFPQARLHSHYGNGATLAEAFWQAVRRPWQLLTLGDPLTQPYARIPEVVLTAPAPLSTLSGTVAIRAAATRPGGGLETDLDLAIDGRLIRIGEPGETVAAVRTADGFSLDTTTLTDGWHEFRVIAYGDDAVRTQGFATVEVTVDNDGGAVALGGPVSGVLGVPLTLNASPVNLSGVAAIEIRTLGRVLAALPPSGGSAAIDTDALSDLDTNRIFAVAILNDGREVSSPPHAIDIAANPIPAIADAPSLPRTIAVARIFEDVKAPGFDWDAAAPVAVVPVEDRFLLTVEQAEQFPFLGDVVGNSGGVEFITRYFAPESERHDFARSGISASDVIVDGVSLFDGPIGGLRKNTLFLEPGWHEIRLRIVLPTRRNDFQTTYEQMVRTTETRRFYPQGWPLHNHAPFDLERCVAPALPLTLPTLTGRTSAVGTAELRWDDPFADETGWRIERFTGHPAVNLIAYNGTNTPPRLVQPESAEALRAFAPVAVDAEDDFFTHVAPWLQQGVRLMTARADRADNGESILYEVDVPAGTTIYALQRADVGNPVPAWMAAQGDWIKVFSPADNLKGSAVFSKNTNRWIISKKEIAASGTVELGGAFDVGIPTEFGEAITFVFIKDAPLWETVATAATDSTSATVGSLGSGIEQLRVTAELPATATIPSNPIALDLGSPTPDAAPFVDAGRDLRGIATGAAFSLKGRVIDDSGSPTLLWSLVSGPGTLAFGDPAAAATTATPSAPGTYIVQLSADDGTQTASDQLTVTVASDAAANAAPSVDAGADASINQTQTLALAAIVSDDGQPSHPGIVRASWRQLDGPGIATFVNAEAAATTATFSSPGTYTLEARASDGLLAAADTLEVEVAANPNSAPSVDLGPPRTVLLDAPLTLNPTVTDDGLPDPPGTLSFIWYPIDGPGNAAFSTTSAPDTEVTFDTVGEHTIGLSVSDGSRTTARQLKVTVEFDTVGNTPPTVDLPETASILFTDPLFIDAAVADDGLPDPPGTLGFSSRKITGPGTAEVFLVQPGGRAVLAFDQPGDYEMELTADDSVESVSDTIAVQVADRVRHRVVWGWGKNSSGQAGPFDSGLANPGLAGMARPFPIGRGWLKAVSTGFASAALTRDGQVLLSGSNSPSSPLLGEPAAPNRSWFAPVPGITDAIDLAEAEESIAVLHADGTVSTWGASNNGSLGHGVRIDTRDTPTRIDGFGDVRALYGSFRTFFALKNDGSLWWWGSGEFGKSGTGTSTIIDSPQPVAGVSGIRQIASGLFHTLILLEDGSVHATGWNFRGQLGLGDSGSGTDRLAFTPVLTGTAPDTPLTAITQIAAGDEHSLALSESGEVYAWGSNNRNQLGTGDSNPRVFATRVIDPGDPSGRLTGVVTIASGKNTVYVLKADGTLLAWGDGTNGALGGTSPSRPVPTLIAGLPQLEAIWAGDFTAFAATPWANYDGFVSEHFTAQEIADGKAAPEFIDPATGLANLALYGLNRAPGESTGEPPVALRVEGGQLVVETETLDVADDLTMRLESSTDLVQWDPATPDEVTFENRGDTKRATLRFTLAPGDERRFLRLRFTAIPSNF